MAAGCSGVFKQFLLLLWKNFLLQIRRPIGTVFEILLPICTVVFIILLRIGLFPRQDQCFSTFKADPLTPTQPAILATGNSSVDFMVTELPRTIYYTPNTTQAAAIVERFSSKLPPSPTEDQNILQGVETEDELMTLLLNVDRSSVAGCFIGGAGIVFNLSDELNIRFTLRLQHEVGDRGTWLTRFTAVPDSPGPRVSNNFYLSDGFLHLQNAVGLSIIEYLAEKQGLPVPNVTVDMRPFPFPAYRSDDFFTTAGYVLPLLIVIGFIYSAGIFVKELVLEKETRIRESMFMMGLTQWILWVPWYLKQFLFLLISVAFMTILLKVGQVFPLSNGFLLFVFFLLFILSMISYGFLISVFFDSARVGMLCGFICWFFTYLPYFFIERDFETISSGSRIAICVLSNTCLGIGIQVISLLEAREEGLQVDNVVEPLNVDDSFHIGFVFMMFIIDAVLYYILAWYINGVKPGQYGIPKPLYFPFLPSYWTGKLQESQTDTEEDEIDLDPGCYDPSAHEQEPTDLTVGISVKNLTKIYSSTWFSKITSFLTKLKQESKVAVNKLSLNVYKDQITALLGHNGAGKTTTLSILTGLFTPTSGSATINGYSILTEMDQIRHSLGICPQHNVLFDRLTIREHLKFFCRLKGVWDRKTVEDEVESMIEDLQLVGKGDVPAGVLSGGMKRKLSVGIALVGGSKMVVLDEPTSGMDPYSRRATWDLLVKHKQGRTMLLTTHFMDEADLLGDRIAIMVDGQLRCSGSSLFLKTSLLHHRRRKQSLDGWDTVPSLAVWLHRGCKQPIIFSIYGIGYHLTVEKEEHGDSTRVSELVTSKVHEAKQVLDVGAEVFYILPSSATSKFPALFDALEARKTELGVASFGVSITTMEEVFIKVGQKTEETLKERLRRMSTVRSLALSTRSLAPSTPRTPVSAAPTIPTISELEEDEEEIQEMHLAFTEDTTNETTLPSNPSETTPLPTQITPPTVSSTDKPRVLTTRFSVEEGDEHDKTETSAQRAESQPTKGYTPNTGLTLWFQQFVAMFLKRFYNSLRFFTAVITQLILPLLLILFGLVFAIVRPFNDQADDPARELRLNNSAISGTANLFWAQLQDSSSAGFNINFSSVDPTTLGASQLFDLTDAINAVRDGVQSINFTESCCSYEYQLLDKFCATRTESELQDACSPNDAAFGYNTCRDRCLSCCTAQERRLASCTNPFSQIRTVTATRSEDLCPSSPLVSYQDALTENPTGPVDSDGTFVAEYLLRLAVETNPAIFYRQYQAGFTVMNRDPSYAACGCGNTRDLALQTCALGFSPLGDQFDGTMDCPYLDHLEECSNETSLQEVVNLREPCLSCDGFSSIPGCSTVNGTAANTLQNLTCVNSGCVNRSVGAIYPNQGEQVSVTVWYNNENVHMSPAALNAFHNILLRQTLNSSYTITVINHPQSRAIVSRASTSTQLFTAYVVATSTLFGYSFLIGTFILFVMQEKESKAKHLQFVSGVHKTSFWLATFAWDLLNAAIAVAVSIILFAATQVEGYRNEGLAAVFLLFVFVMWSSIPLTYVFSFFFQNYLAAFGIFFCFYVFSAVAMQTIIFFTDDVNVADILHYIFLIFPGYGLAIGMNDIFLNEFARGVCSTSEEIAAVLCQDSTLQGSDMSLRFADSDFNFARPAIGSILTYMAIEGVVFLMLTLLLEAKFFSSEIKGFLGHYKNGSYGVEDEEVRAVETLPLPGEDTDVFNERKKVLMGQTTEDDVVVVKDLHKVYSQHLVGCALQPAKAAVQGISLAIPNGECFGLLGVNGAGKTTTFNIITGDIPMTEGSASISGFDIRTNLRDVQQRIGYCPQFDAFINRLTGRELLTMFSRLRGIPEHLIKKEVESVIQRLDLSQHSDKQCGTYSGGNKRKLSTGIALVGSPSIILLDEPTSGMDVATRRYLWDVLTAITQEGHSIILTSHSMEECEALCNRLAIMVNGRFKCLGSIQHLKNKYGAGFTFNAKVKLMPPPIPEPQKKVRKFSRQLSTVFGLQRKNTSSSPPSLHRQRTTGSIFGFGRQKNNAGFQRQTSSPPSFQQQGTADSISELGGQKSLERNVSLPNENNVPTKRTTSSIFRRINTFKRKASAARDVVPFNPFDTTMLHDFIKEKYPGALLLEEHQGAVSYQLPGNGITWSSIFRQIEDNKERLGIVDYSVSQTTLEQVFINFAREQESGGEHHRN